jgi:putative addiction module component (TIGR02574 family)
MTAAAQKRLFEQALALPRSARARLAKKLLDSLKPADEKVSRKEWNAAWKVELEKRVADIGNSKVEWIPWEQVRSELRTKYGMKL